MKKVVLLGGLGNQLFGLQFAKFLETLTNRPVELIADVRIQSSTLHGSRLEDIPGLNMPELVKRTIFERLRIGILFRIASRRAPTSYVRSEFLGATYFSNPGHTGNYDFSIDGANHIYLGHFQTYKFGLHLEIGLSNPLKRREGSDTVALHVRYGDYLNHKSTIGVLSEEYFKAAIKNQMDIADFETLQVFGTPGAASEKLLIELQRNFPGLKIISNLGTKHNRNAVHDLTSLANFERHIISNSTFAWWGAWLSGSECVVAPSKWFRALSDPIDLIPPKWTTCESKWL